MFEYIRNLFKKEPEDKTKRLEEYLNRKNLIYTEKNYSSINIKTYLYSNDIEKQYVSTVLIDTFGFDDYRSDIFYNKIDNDLYIIWDIKYILNNLESMEIGFEHFTNVVLGLSKDVKNKYKFDLLSFKNIATLYTTKKDLFPTYDLIHIEQNKMIINSRIEANKFIYGHKFRLYELPESCRTVSNQLEFYTNSNNEIIEVKIFTNNKNHPNIDYRTNKFCIGNYRFKQLNKDTVINIIDNFKIYNLVSSYFIPRNLKKHIETIVTKDEEVVFFT